MSFRSRKNRKIILNFFHTLICIEKDKNQKTSKSQNFHTIYSKDIIKPDKEGLTITKEIVSTLDRIMSSKHSRNNCIGPECHLCCCFL